MKSLRATDKKKTAVTRHERVQIVMSYELCDGFPVHTTAGP
jgi:hypothetical protein